ncbi:hypothetical protein SD311_012830 [Staphylococcus sp. KG4-3]|uniref:DUF340 domain-containing protein n=1 Tax=Staphylococcus xylosus TaxID=1288 RepID=A0A418IRR6_STAXY|nr:MULTISPECIES: hypothetical protein [Staphylococcus]MBF0812634.1 hypothetical protein [Staphylococcus saprophyticus]MDW8543231.1 hypothetical protein [Staphylococcus sp. KG4-1]MDW8562651.1 hypothetical protein [Staphylococcus sp. KG4-3]RIN12583.1 hypothetical protein BU097_01740 [Staphylococcus xylosus]TFV25583.1 hypothetical protein E4T75_02790 [Staphylococcus saprophyticus]
MSSKVTNWVLTLCIVGIISLFSNWIGYNVMPTDAIPGIIALMGIALLGLILRDIVPLNIPSIAYIGIIGLIITIPGVPGSSHIVDWTEKVDLLSLATPVVAYAGVSIGNSWADFAKLGWKTIIIGIVILLSTYIGSALVAEIILKIQGLA